MGIAIARKTGYGSTHPTGYGDTPSWTTATFASRYRVSKIGSSELAEAIERCRKLMLFSKAAIAIGGPLIVAMAFGAIRFDPTVMIGAITAVIGGTVLLGSNSSTSQVTTAALKAAEEQRAELIGRIDLQVVGEGDRGNLLPRPDEVIRD